MQHGQHGGGGCFTQVSIKSSNFGTFSPDLAETLKIWMQYHIDINVEPHNAMHALHISAYLCTWGSPQIQALCLPFPELPRWPLLHSRPPGHTCWQQLLRTPRVWVPTASRQPPEPRQPPSPIKPQTTPLKPDQHISPDFQFQEILLQKGESSTCSWEAALACASEPPSPTQTLNNQQLLLLSAIILKLGKVIVTLYCVHIRQTNIDTAPPPIVC